MIVLCASHRPCAVRRAPDGSLRRARAQSVPGNTTRLAPRPREPAPRLPRLARVRGPLQHRERVKHWINCESCEGRNGTYLPLSLRKDRTSQKRSMSDIRRLWVTRARLGLARRTNPAGFSSQAQACRWQGPWPQPAAPALRPLLLGTGSWDLTPLPLLLRALPNRGGSLTMPPALWCLNTSCEQLCLKP